MASPSVGPMPSTTTTTTTTMTTEPKFRRYRSVRKASEEQLAAAYNPADVPPCPAAPPLPLSSSVGDVHRSASRYHRRPRAATASNTNAPAVPSLEKTAPSPKRPATSRTREEAWQYQQRARSNTAGKTSRVAAAPPVQKPTDFVLEKEKLGWDEPLSFTLQQPSVQAREGARNLLEQEQERYRKIKEEQRRKKDEERARRKAQEAADAARQRQLEEEERERQRLAEEKEMEARRVAEQAEAERLRILEVERRTKKQQEIQKMLEKKQREEERKRVEQERKLAQQQRERDAELARLEREEKRKTLERKGSGGLLGMFKKKSPMLESEPFYKIPNNTMQTAERNDSGFEQTIRPGGGGVVPGIDAPISAVNAGERRIMIERNGKRMRFPVTPDTTPLDLIRSAATCFSSNVNPEAAVLLENFNKVGLQRPLRMYEHVRDTMNSWDSDAMNELNLMDSATGGNDMDLIIECVPADRPNDISFGMYYSQQPGKWSKKWVTIQSSGQIVVSKPGSSKDITKACHLSDFDIYTPTKYGQKVISSPKKVCFGIKSQHRSGMFLTTANFVHFFCTNDRDVGAQFYSAVQAWRSWHLVNVLGRGKPSSSQSSDSLLDKDKRRTSIESHYQLGSFKPLLDITKFDHTAEPLGLWPPPDPNPQPRTSVAIADSETRDRTMSLRKTSSPPAPTGGRLRKEDPSRPKRSSTRISVDMSDPFASTGLLGRTYTIRQEAASQMPDEINGPFTGGGLVSGAGTGLARNASTRSRVRPSLDVSRRSQPPLPSDVERTMSMRNAPPMPAPPPAGAWPGRPLVDLTPQYVEPPQHSRKGRGFIPAQIGLGGLIDAATTPEQAIEVPAATSWRKNEYGNQVVHSNTFPLTNGHASLPNGSGIRPGTSSGAAIGAQQVKPQESNEKFLFGDGLLAHAKPGQGGTGRGRGVATGGRGGGVGKPMVELGQESTFAKGSLLHRVESEETPRERPMDRSKGREATIRVGEGC